MRTKKLFIVLGVVLFLATNVLAFDPMGPPVATLKQNQFSANVEYLFSNMDLDADGLTLGGLTFGSDTIESIESNKIYANLGFGMTDNWEVFLRLGAVDAEIDRGDNRNNLASLIGDADYDFAIGGGTKITFSESDDGKEKWGILAQLSWTDLNFDDKAYSYGGFTGTLSADVDVIEVQIALGPTYQLDDTISVYGGPFLHFVDGDAEVKGAVNGFSGKGSTDIEEDSVFGGYIGTQIELTENLDFNTEFQVTGGGYAIGAALLWRF